MTKFCVSRVLKKIFPQAYAQIFSVAQISDCEIALLEVAEK